LSIYVAELKAMSRSGRYLFNSFVCVLVVAHAVYWLMTGRLEGATSFRVALWAGQLVLGCVGLAWFMNRARVSR
jgi:hypothetical protein